MISPRHWAGSDYARNYVRNYARNMLSEIIEAAPFIDVVLDDDVATVAKLTPGFNKRHNSEQLFSHILTARMALAVHKEAYRNVSSGSAVCRHQVLIEAAASLRLDGGANAASNPVSQPGPIDAALSKRASSLTATVQSLQAGAVNQHSLAKLANLVTGSSNPWRQAPFAAGEHFSSQVSSPGCPRELALLMANWQEYVELAGRQTEPLVVVAIAYYQLLAISPFVQDNPALSRMVLQVLLVDMGLIDLPLLSLSREIQNEQTAHRLAFEEVSVSGEWHNWLSLCLTMIGSAAQQSVAALHAYQLVETDLQKRVRVALPKTDAKVLSDLLLENPVCRIRDVVVNGVAKRQTASVYLKKLCDEGLLFEQQQGKEKWFFNKQYLSIFE